jgi:ribosomal protein L11 methyltransferase
LPWQVGFVCQSSLLEGQTADQWLEDLSERLLEAGALSVSIEDADADLADREQAIFGEPGSDPALRVWPSSRLQLILADEEDPQAWCDRHLVPEGLESITISRLTDEDWVTKTQSQFTPLEVLDTLWIGPSWHEAPARYRSPPRLALTIDPGMAFGTGGHATTQLCLEAILRAREQGSLAPSSSLLDYGCGSGILALAAAASGLTQVVAVDIDLVAVKVAHSNALHNQLDHRIRFLSADQDLWSVGGLPAAGVDLVVANILAQPLKLLAPLLWGLAAPTGGLVLSGLLASQADALIAHYAEVAPNRPTLSVLGMRDGWACIGYLPQAK